MNANFKYHALKLWETVKLKFLFNLEPKSMNKVIDWIGENLLILSENENIP